MTTENSTKRPIYIEFEEDCKFCFHYNYTVVKYLFLAIVVSNDDRSEGSTEVKRTPLTLSETRWRLDLSYPTICATTTFSIEVDIPIWCTDLESFD